MTTEEINKSKNSWCEPKCYFNNKMRVDIAIIVHGILAIMGFALIRAYPTALTTELGKLRSFLIMSPLIFGLFGIVNITCIKIWSVRRRYLFYNSASAKWDLERTLACKEFLEQKGHQVIIKEESGSLNSV